MAASAVIVNVADRCGEPTAHADRLPAGHGTLPLERLISDLVADGFDGAVEFDPVGEAAEILGYDGVWRETSLVAEAWADRIAVGCRGVLGNPSESPRADVRGVRPAHLRAGSSSRRSHASSHTGSPG
jgi:hypothetical protein